MLNKLRESLQPTMQKLGSSFASTGLSANFWTGFSLALAFVAAGAYASSEFFGTSAWVAAIAGGILLLVSGFFDVVDGAVARATQRATKKGAFLDSTFDKIAEVAIFAGIAFGGLANPLLVTVTLGLSLIVSYTRARAESLGVELKGIGIGERAERMLILAIIGMIPFMEEISFGGQMNWAVSIVAIVAGITLIQRVIATISKL